MHIFIGRRRSQSPPVSETTPPNVSMSLSPNLSLHNGAAMPAIGFGTWGLKPTDVDTALRAAVETGYRLFDLAPVYNNQREVGATLAAMQADFQDKLGRSKYPPKCVVGIGACTP